MVTLVSSLAVVMVCCLGFANFTIETDGESKQVTLGFVSAFVYHQ